MNWVILIVCGLVGFLCSLMGMFFMVSNCPEIGIADLYHTIKNPGNRPRWIGLGILAAGWLVYLLSWSLARELLSGAEDIILYVGWINIAFSLLLTIFGEHLGKSFMKFVDGLDDMFPAALPARTWGAISLVVFASLNLWLGWLQ